MFNNREARIRFVKPKKDEDSTTVQDKILHPDTVKLIAERSKEAVKYTALAVIGVYAAIKAIDTASQVIVKKTKNADNEK